MGKAAVRLSVVDVTVEKFLSFLVVPLMSVKR
jgi:hypothetical protein